MDRATLPPLAENTERPDAPCAPTAPRKHLFRLDNFQTAGRESLSALAFGYECHGRQNAAGDNSILLIPPFGGHAHVAGRYRSGDTIAGYLDGVIGPGKLFDTRRYHVICADGLANMNADCPDVCSTGPSSIDALTGQTYGAAFPCLSVQDMVAVQHALLRQLGVTKLHAVVGGGLASAQALDWAAAHPDMVERVIAPAPIGLLPERYLVNRLGSWLVPVLSDAFPLRNFRRACPPQSHTGLVAALQRIANCVRDCSASGMSYHALQAPPNELQAPERDFLLHLAFGNSATRFENVDPLAFCYQVRAYQTWRCGRPLPLADACRHMRARMLFLTLTSDLFARAHCVDTAVAELRAHGVCVDSARMDEEGGHLAWESCFTRQADLIASFLAD